jgi:hypothetical protein
MQLKEKLLLSASFISASTMMSITLRNIINTNPIKIPNTDYVKFARFLGNSSLFGFSLVVTGITGAAILDDIM